MEASGQALRADKRYLLDVSGDIRSRMTGLQLSAYFGVEAAVKILYETVEVDMKDNEAVVKLLLEHEADTCSENTDGRLFLLLAIKKA